MVVGAAASLDELLGRASALQRQGRVEEAIAAYHAVLAAQPNLPDSWYNLAFLQRHARQFEAALISYKQALDAGISRPEEVHLNRAVILSDYLARPDAAEADLAAALKINPHYVPAMLNLGNLHEDRGDREGARSAYEQALAVEPSNMLALARLAATADIRGKDDPVILRLTNALSRPLPAADQADLGFALGRSLDAVGAYDEAFAAIARANAASRAASGGPRYDRTASEQLVDRLIRAFPRQAPADRQSTIPAPIFICGMFRSGSTLVERILASHSKVTGGGELDLLPAIILSDLSPFPEAVATASPEKFQRLANAYLSAARAMHPQATHLTDKRPDNFLLIGLIKTLFPHARIIHTRRNPLDNCLSIYFLQLGPAFAYATELADIAHWYGNQDRLMRHWKSLYPNDIFEVDYDGLVADPRSVAQRMLDFCNFDWEENCLEFHRVEGVVKTASVWQVREPLHCRSSGRWRNYEGHLQGLRRALDGTQGE